MPNKKYDWLYIIFVHESGFAKDGKMVDGFFDNQIENLEKCNYNDKVKVIIVLNYPKVVRTLTKKEKMILADPRRDSLIFFETWIYENQNNNGKIRMQNIHKTNYWQDGLDFVFVNFSAKQNTLHTVSHSTCYEINSTNNGFALNAFANQVKAYKSELSSYNNSYFKTTLNQIIKKKAIKYYLFAGQPKANNKVVKLFALHKKHYKKWGTYNNTNGLLFYDFVRYLKPKKIIFEFLFLNNCGILLYQNMYLLNGIANLTFGSTGDINAEFVNAEIVYNGLMINDSPEQKIKTIFKDCLEFINNKDAVELTKNRHYTIINTKNLSGLNEKLKKIFSTVNDIMQKSKAHSLALKEHILFEKDNVYTIISDDHEKPYYDLLEFLKSFATYNNNTFGKLLSVFEQDLLSPSIMIHSHTGDDKNHHLSICFPNHQQILDRVTYLRNFFKQPQNSFAKETGFDKFISKLHSLAPNNAF